jgi:predicted enzyme related to lactoylglutathione lyase
VAVRTEERRSEMAKVTGLGGVFFRSADPQALKTWYREQLGIESESWGFAFRWRELAETEQQGYTVWSPFPESTEYFAPSAKQFMLNYRVDDLEGLLEKLGAAGVQIAGEVQKEENGKFAWIIDPEGNKIELWEPVDSHDDPYVPD